MKITTIIYLSIIYLPIVNAQQVVKNTINSTTNSKSSILRQTIGQPVAPKKQQSFLYGFQAPLIIRIEKDLAPKIVVYPNPVSEVLQIVIPKKGYIYQFSTVSGQLISRGVLKEINNSLSVQNVPNGIFIFTLFSPKKQLLKQLKIIRK